MDSLLLGPRDNFGAGRANKCNYLNDDFNWEHEIKQALKRSGARVMCRACLTTRGPKKFDTKCPSTKYRIYAVGFHPQKISKRIQ